MYERFYPRMDRATHAASWPWATHSQWVQAGGIAWHVQRMGRGPLLLLLHGTGSGSFSWRHLMPRLAEHFELLVPDLPGHALTDRGPPGALSLQGMAEGLRALLWQLQLTPHAVLGHSAGAAVAAQLMLQQPSGSACPVVGLNPAWLPLPGAAAWLFSPVARLAELNPLSAWALAKWAARPGTVEQAIARTGSHLTDEGIAWYRRVFSHPGHVHGVLSMMAAWQIRPLAEQLPRLRNPVFLHIGAQDHTVPLALSDQALALLPQAQRVVAPGLGHLAHEEDPEGTARQLIAWLA